MGVSYSYDDRIVVLELDGPYTQAELKDAVLGALADEVCPRDPLGMLDTHDSATLAARSTAELESTARFVGSLAPRFNRRVAIVAASDLVFGLMRLSAAFAEHEGVANGGIEVHVFRARGAARAWLLEGAAPSTTRSVPGSPRPS